MNPTFIQQDPGIERRRKLALAMKGREKSGPIRTGMEGAGRLAQSLANTYGLYSADKEQKEYNKGAQEDLARIMSDYSQDVRPLSQHPGTSDIATQIQMQQMAGDKAAEAAQAARIQGLEDHETKLRLDKKYANQKPRKIISDVNGYQYYEDDQTRVFPDAKKEKKTPLINMGDSYSPLQKELAKGNAKSFVTWRDQAIAAGKMVPYIDIMESVANDIETGKGEKAMATLGQWLGTDAGTALQTWKAAQVPIMLQMAEQVSGPMTEKEWDMLREALPNFGTDPAANRVVVKLLRKSVDGTRENFEAAQSYMQSNNGTLQGYMPSYAKREAAKSDGADGDWQVMEDDAGNKAYVNKKTGAVKEL